MTEKEREVYHILVRSEVTKRKSGYLYWCGEVGELPPEPEEGMEICGDCLTTESMAYRVLRVVFQSATTATFLELLEKVRSLEQEA